MQKFRSFVEEGGVVLVALEHKFGSPAQAKAPAEVFRDTSDEEIWAAAGDRTLPSPTR